LKKAEVKAAPVAEKTYATQAPSPAARKILDEKNIEPSELLEQEKEEELLKMTL
jgi:2-oxoglutarate dehydrogenase E2 component (dihydrolipoamide succinyltransferase)